MKKFLEKLTIVVTSCMMGVTCLLPIHAEEDFDAWMHQEFIDTMENDYVTMHYTIRDYKKEGIEKPEVTFGVPSMDKNEKDLKDLEDTLKKLQSFDYDKLDDRQKHDYKAYEFYLVNTIGMAKYPMMDQWFSPSEGIQSGLISNLTEFVFYDKEDFEDYLTLLKTVPDFFKGALEITKQQVKEGFFLTDMQLAETLDSMAKFVQKTDQSPLIILFNQKVDQFEGLSEDQKNELKARNKELVIKTVMPTYLDTAKELAELKGSRKFKGGLCNYEKGGKEYYEFLAHRKTGSSKSVQEQFDQCSDYLRGIIQRIMNIYATNGNVDHNFETETVGMDTPDEILDYLRNHMEDYPKGPEVQYTYSYLDPSVANDSTVAYYMQPPLDDIKDNVIRINKDNISNENGLYETLAHEGFPGHLYQVTWYLNTKPNLLRACLNNIGYSEGWAMYTEINSWRKSPLKKEVSELHSLYTAMNYVEDAAVDLAVNGLGYNQEQIEDWLVSIGLNTSQSAFIYQHAINYPGLLLPYGVGLMNFFLFEDMAQRSLGDEFDVVKFNEVLLTNGERPFDSVEQDVKAFIQNKGKPVEEPTPVPVQEEQSEGFFSSSEGVKVLIGVFAIIAAVAWIANRRYRKDDPFAQ